MPPFTQDEIEAEFPAHQGACIRVNSGYTNVFRPGFVGQPTSAQSAPIVIEPSGAVSLRNEDVATQLAAEPRDEGEVFRGTGSARWWLTTAEIDARYGTAAELVAALVQACEQRQLW